MEPNPQVPSGPLLGSRAADGRLLEARPLKRLTTFGDSLPASLQNLWQECKHLLSNPDLSPCQLPTRNHGKDSVINAQQAELYRYETRVQALESLNAEMMNRLFRQQDRAKARSERRAGADPGSTTVAVSAGRRSAGGGSMRAAVPLRSDVCRDHCGACSGGQC